MQLEPVVVVVVVMVVVVVVLRGSLRGGAQGYSLQGQKLARAGGPGGRGAGATGPAGIIRCKKAAAGIEGTVSRREREEKRGLTSRECLRGKA